MKHLFVLIVLIVSSCDSYDNSEKIKIGLEKTEFLEIKNFPNNLKAKNIILLVGDGLALNHITLSRIAAGGLDHRLFIDQLPYHVTSLTQSF